MAETPETTVRTESPRPRQDVWVLAALAGTALVCISALAVALVLILGRQNAGSAGPQNMGNPVINIGALAPGGASIQRPSEPAKPQAVRSSAQDSVQPALPGMLSTAATGKREKQLIRAETSAVPAPSFPTPVVVSKYKQRGDAPSLYTGDRALPMPIRYAPEAAAPARATQAQVVFGKAPDAGVTPLPADQLYIESGVHAGALNVQLSHPRKTMVGGAYRAPQGFWFFTADIHLDNQGAKPVAVAPLNFELHDAEGARSMGLPEWSTGLPDAPLAPGASADGTLSFLVYDDVEIKELALLGAAPPVIVPLSKK